MGCIKQSPTLNPIQKVECVYVYQPAPAVTLHDYRQYDTDDSEYICSPKNRAKTEQLIYALIEDIKTLKRTVLFYRAQERAGE